MNIRTWLRKQGRTRLRFTSFNGRERSEILSNLRNLSALSLAAARGLEDISAEISRLRESMEVMHESVNDLKRISLDSRVMMYDNLGVIREKLLQTHALTSSGYDLFRNRLARPYYPLNSGSALTFLEEGLPFFINTADRIVSPWIIMGGHWERNVDRVLMSYVSPGMTVVDVGAHMGYYTVKFANKVGRSGAVFAFEPNSSVNSVCFENIRINGFSDIATLHRVALGDEAGELTLSFPDNDTAAASLVGDHRSGHVERVSVVRADDILPEGVRVDLFKIDAEGFEPKVLAGARETLSRNPDCAIMVEINLSNWRSTLESNFLHELAKGKAIYAVTKAGTLRRIAVSEVEEVLNAVADRENYFLIANTDLVEKHCCDLIEFDIGDNSFLGCAAAKPDGDT